MVEIPPCRVAFFAHERKGLGGFLATKRSLPISKNHPNLNHNGFDKILEQYPLRPLRLGEKYPQNMVCMGHNHPPRKQHNNHDNNQL